MKFLNSTNCGNAEVENVADLQAYWDTDVTN